jgi:hypothetical protein
MNSWYEGLGSIRTVDTHGVPTTQVITSVSGASCRCYNMPREDIPPVARQYTYEGEFGGTTFFCNCANRAVGSTMTIEQIGAMVQTPEFREAASAAVASELGVSSWTPLKRMADVDSRRSLNILGFGVAGVLLGGAVGLFLFMRGRKHNA